MKRISMVLLALVMALLLAMGSVGTVFASRPIAERWVYWGGHYYTVTRFGADLIWGIGWETARDCSRRFLTPYLHSKKGGADLVSINTVAELWFVQNLTETQLDNWPYDTIYWIGLYQLPNQSNPRDGWRWVDGTELVCSNGSFAAWMPYLSIHNDPPEPDDQDESVGGPVIENNEANWAAVNSLYDGVPWWMDCAGNSPRIVYYVVEFTPRRSG